jgi:SAM-dependent methyltransferase
VPVACGDATRLPVRDDAVVAVLAAHVLHLVADWRVVLAEIERVTRPGGLLLATRGGDGVGLRSELTAVARKAAGWTRPAGRLDRLDALDAELTGRGAELTMLPPVATGRTHTAAEDLQAITDNLGSWTWEWTEDQRVTAEAAAREWVTTTYGDPESVQIESAPIRWHCYRLPG